MKAATKYIKSLITTHGNAMLSSTPVIIAEETSPPVSMKSKTTGLNFMVSVGRAIESGDNALAKLLQASQELVSSVSHHILC